MSHLAQQVHVVHFDPLDVGLRENTVVCNIVSEIFQLFQLQQCSVLVLKYGLEQIPEFVNYVVKIAIVSMVENLIWIIV